MKLKTTGPNGFLETKTDTLDAAFINAKATLSIKDNLIKVQEVDSVNSNKIKVLTNVPTYETPEVYVEDKQGEVTTKTYTDKVVTDNSAIVSTQTVIENTDPNTTLTELLDAYVETPTYIDGLTNYNMDYNLRVFRIKDRTYYVSNNRYIVRFDETGILGTPINMYPIISNGYIYTVIVDGDRLLFTSNKNTKAIFILDANLIYNGDATASDVEMHILDVTNTDITTLISGNTTMTIIGEMLVIKCGSHASLYYVHKVGLDVLSTIDTTGLSITTNKAIFYRYKRSVYLVQLDYNKSVLRLSIDDNILPSEYIFVQDYLQATYGTMPLVDGKIVNFGIKKYIDLETKEIVSITKTLPTYDSYSAYVFTPNNVFMRVKYNKGFYIYPKAVPNKLPMLSETELTFSEDMSNALTIYPKYNIDFKVNDILLQNTEVTINSDFDKINFNFTKENMTPTNQIKQSFKIPKKDIRVLNFRTNVYKG